MDINTSYWPKGDYKFTKTCYGRGFNDNFGLRSSKI